MSTPNIDTVFINSLELPIRIGCLPDERAQPQVISVDVAIDFTPTNAAFSKNINDTVCYLKTSELIKALANERPYVLLEEFGHEICNGIFTHNPEVRSITLTIRKFVVRNAASVGVTLRRENRVLT